MNEQRLIKLRERKGWSKTETAKRLHIANSTYSGYEYGHRKPDGDTLVRIANLFEVSTDYLLGNDVGSSDDFDSFMFADKEGFDNLPEDVKEELIREVNEKIEFLKYKQSKKDNN